MPTFVLDYMLRPLLKKQEKLKDRWELYVCLVWNMQVQKNLYSGQL